MFRYFVVGFLGIFCVAFSSENKSDVSRPLRGIVLYQGEQPVERARAGVHLVGFADISYPEELREHLSSYLHTHSITKENLILIKQEIIRFFAKTDPNLIIVAIPEQKVERGVVFFQVYPAKVGSVEYSGNYWIPRWHYTNQLKAEEGEPLCKGKLLDSAAWLNLNPFRHVDVVFSPGKEKETTDVEFLIQDRFPMSLSVGADNTGNSFIGNNRYYVDVLWGNVAGLGDLFSYQLIMADEYKRFHSHYGSLQFYLPWRHLLKLVAAYSKTNTTVENTHNKGKNLQASFRYNVPFSPLYCSFKHQLSFGWDYKAANTNLFFISQENQMPAVNKTADLDQIYLGYELQDSFSAHHILFKIDTFSSPFKIMEGQTRAAYSNFRLHARPFYFYSKLQTVYTYKMPWNLSFYGQLRGQAASITLLPSETFGIGGNGSVRGYTERAFIADNAVVCNIELRHNLSPVIPYRDLEDSLITYLFIDFGWGYDYTKTATDAAQSPILASIGPGVHYQISRYLKARLDYGFQLSSLKGSKDNFGKLHFGATAQW